MGNPKPILVIPSAEYVPHHPDDPPPPTPAELRRDIAVLCRAAGVPVIDPFAGR